MLAIKYLLPTTGQAAIRIPALPNHPGSICKKILAGPVQPIPFGLKISLGNRAELIVVAANGRVWHTASATE